MKLYVLDTDHASLFQREHHQVVARIGEKSPEQLAVAIITAEEQLKGWLAQIKRASSSQSRITAFAGLRKTIRYFNTIQILDYDFAAETQFANLRQQKIRIGTQDLRIAAIALSTGSILVTRNCLDFAKVPGLMLEDWSV